MSVLGIWKCLGRSTFRQMRLFPQNLVATCSRDFDFQAGWLEPDAFFRHILLAISTPSCLFLEFESVLQRLHSSKWDCLLRIWWHRVIDFKLNDLNQMLFLPTNMLAILTTSCPFMEFESVLESQHSGKCDCLLRIWLQRALAISISSWMTGTRCIFADTFCWLSWQPHVYSWNLKVSRKVCIQANATVSSEFGGNVFSRCQFQVGWLEPDAFCGTFCSNLATEKTTYKYLATDNATYIVTTQRVTQHKWHINIVGKEQEVLVKTIYVMYIAQSNCTLCH